MVAAYTADGLPAPVTRGDRAALKRSGKARDAHLQGLYELGRARQQPPEGLSAEEQRVYEGGLDEADRIQDHPEPKPKASKRGRGGDSGPLAAGHPEGPDRGPRPSRPKAGRPSSRSSGGRSQQLITVGQQGAGALLGLIAYAVAINGLRGGATGVKSWFYAKFFNSSGNGANNGSNSAYSNLHAPATTPGGPTQGEVPAPPNTPLNPNLSPVPYSGTGPVPPGFQT